MYNIYFPYKVKLVFQGPKSINSSYVYPIAMATAQKYISHKQASQDIRGAKKPQVLTGAVISCYILPEYVKDNNGGAC